MKDSEPIRILLSELPALDRLEPLWMSLECRADASFFISWGWIGTWVESLPQKFKPQLLQVVLDSDLVGLGILVNHRYWRHGLIPVTETHLNETGTPHYDSLTIEYNDILWDRNLPVSVKESALKRLMSEHVAEEFHAAGVDPDSYWTSLAPVSTGVSTISKECNGVDLDAVRTEGDYLRLISTNTRTKIRKALKACQQVAELRVCIAEDAHQAEVMYESLVRLHQQTWLNRGKPGAFANRYVYQFHCNLIRKRFASREIQLLSIYSGERLMGVLYNFVFRGQVYNYQSGIDYTSGYDRFKPGLLIHSLAIEFCAKAGFAYYDLMAGDSQYKRSLGTKSNHLNWLIFQKPKLKFGIEELLRQSKRLLFKPAAL